MKDIFKPTLEIRKQLQKTIKAYELATFRDKKKVESICAAAIESIKDQLQVDYVTTIFGTITDEDYSVLVSKGDVSLNITFKNFLTYYTAEVKTSQQEQLLTELSSIGILDAATNANTLIEQKFPQAEMETPALLDEYTEAKQKMDLIQQRQQATLKWFLIPSLLNEEDIMRFLNSLKEEQLETVAEEMCVDTTQGDTKELIIGALTI